MPSIPGEWTCGNCHATKCWPVRTRCYRCGMARNGAPSHPIPGYPDPGRPPYPPPGWPREQNALGRSPLPGPTGIAPTISARKMSQAARKAANKAQPAQVSKLQALELLKDELDTAVVESLQARLSQPRVIPPKRPEDLLRSKKIEWEKTETQLAAASAKAEKLREQLVELDQSIIDLGERVSCLKTEWRELKDKLESDTSKKDDESGMDDSTPDEKEDGGEDADYFEPLRYKVRRKFKRAADAERLESETKAAYDAVNFQGLVSHLMTTTAPDKLPDLLQEMCSNVFARVAETAIAQSGGQVAEGKKAYESLLHNAKQNTFPCKVWTRSKGNASGVLGFRRMSEKIQRNPRFLMLLQDLEFHKGIVVLVLNVCFEFTKESVIRTQYGLLTGFSRQHGWTCLSAETRSCRVSQLQIAVSLVLLTSRVQVFRPG